MSERRKMESTWKAAGEVVLAKILERSGGHILTGRLGASLW